MELEKITKSKQKLEILRSMGIHEVRDLLTHYPFRYSLNEVTHAKEFVQGKKVFFECDVCTGVVTDYYGKRSISRFIVLYEEEEYKVKIFNRPYLKLSLDTHIVIEGKYDGNHQITAYSISTKPLETKEGLIPVYNLKSGISQNDMHRYIEKAFALYKGKIIDVVNETYRKKYNMMHKEEAMYEIHFPSSQENLKKALFYMKYEEFMKFHVTLASLKKQDKLVGKKERKSFEKEKILQVIQTLPFELSKDQITCLHDIYTDMENDTVMYRLLQGDVGSGKTVVAFLAMYASKLSGYQSVLMAPTEILAKQHYESLKKILPDAKVTLLTGNMKNKEEVYQEIYMHKVDYVIGTHALFQEKVDYAKLGLIITDEQHRFGVEQRKRLKEKGNNADILLMSATPIPRTLALSLYGDMDVSTIQTLPSGRKKVKTELIRQNSFASRFDDIVGLLESGIQMYVIVAMIDENEDMQGVKNAQSVYEALKKVLGRYANVGIMHGKMSGDEKEQVMLDFEENRIQVLVSTTVVEVGVNVPNANIMVIYNSDRFGLSQLHQLRGRIGRGDKQGYCYLLTGSKDDATLKRLEVLTKTNDGFEIAKEDLAARGAGEILGVRQSGSSGFILGDIILDFDILEMSRIDGNHVMEHLDDEENKMMKLWLQLYQKNNVSYMD